MSTDLLERPEALTGLDVVVDVDMTLEPACESSGHDQFFWHSGPAHYLIRVQGHCRKCDFSANRTYLICKSGFDFAGTNGLRCVTDTCDAHFERHEWWHVLSEI